jgi:Sulfotransferase family
VRAVAGAQLPGAADATLTAAGDPRAPVIVLAPAYSGAGALRSLLAEHPDLACTAGTGLLPLCEQAMATWRAADARPAGPPSAMACTATRVLANSVIISILARARKSRWCEVAAANPEAAATFLRLYPGTRFLCLHRACPGFIRAALDASPWGITDPVFAAFTSRHPANTVASLTSYWVTATGPLLAFERDHPQSCLRVRFEDLTRGRPAQERITSFLGLADAAGPQVPAGQPTPAGQPASGGYLEPGPASADADAAADLPVTLIPPALLAQANDLLRQLDYPPMGANR